MFDHEKEWPDQHRTSRIIGTCTLFYPDDSIPTSKVPTLSWRFCTTNIYKQKPFISILEDSCGFVQTLYGKMFGEFHGLKPKCSPTTLKFHDVKSCWILNFTIISEPRLSPWRDALALWLPQALEMSWKPRGEVSCCDSWMAERTWWTERWLKLSLSIYISIHPSFHPSTYLGLSVYLSNYLSIYLTICLSIHFSLYVSECWCLTICLSLYLSIWLFWLSI